LSLLVIIALLSTLAVLPVYGGNNSGGNSGNNDQVPVLITFKQQPGAAEEALVRKAGGKVNRTYHLVPGMAATLPQNALDGLSKNPNVTAIEPDGLVYAVDAADIAAELNKVWGVKDIGSGQVHAEGNVGAGVKVGIIDSGIVFNHVDLPIQYGNSFDFVNNDPTPEDENGHGSHVAGTVAGTRDNGGLVGVAPGVQLHIYKVLGSGGSGSFSNVIAAVEMAVDDGVDVTNNSYGSSQNPGGLVQAAFDIAAAQGVLHVGAAGNSGNPKGKGNNIIYPARYGSVMAITATDINQNRASFSSTGDTAEAAGPGVNIHSTVPSGSCEHCDSDYYNELNGTSMASPHAAGVAALVFAAGDVSASEVRQILTGTAVDLGDSGRDPQFGYGLVDAYAAVEAVTYDTDPTPTPTPEPTPTPGPTPTPEPTPTPIPTPVPPPPGSEMYVSVTTDKASYVHKDDAFIDVVVTETDANGAAMGGVSVSVLITTAKGNTLSASNTTGSNGMAKFRYRVNSKRDGKGTYNVEATATMSGYPTEKGYGQFQVTN
ncbi:MAG: S8 family serine peptidase, partial [Dehalococcoidia bacterium]